MNEKIKGLVQEITGLAFEINTTTKFATFIRYSGHVDYLSVDIRLSKKEYEVVVADTGFIYLNSSDYEDKDDFYLRLEKRLKSVTAALSRILENGIPEFEIVESSRIVREIKGEKLTI